VCYRSFPFRDAFGAAPGKVERFNRTLLEEWAYVRPYASEAERATALAEWLHLYNHHRPHRTQRQPTLSRINDLAGQYN